MKDALQQGQRIRGDYEVVRVLGTTAVDRAYLARAGHRRYVIREFNPPAEHERHLTRITAHIERQVEVVTAYSHPGLPHIHEHFVWDGLVYLVRESHDDPTVIDVLSHMQGPPPEEVVRDWMRQLLDVVAYLHRQRPPFVFSGLRPNVLTISKKGVVRLRDYPTPCFLPTALQWKQACILAPGYIAPEQEGGREGTPVSDIYALGQILYFMLTRTDPVRVPYSRDGLKASRDITETMLNLVDRTTRRHPGERPQSVSSFRKALQVDSQAPAERAVDFTLDPRAIDIDGIQRGEVVRRQIHFRSKSGRDIHGTVHSDVKWVRFKFEAFHGSQVDVDFTVATQDFELGQSYQGAIQFDTDAGANTVRLEIHMAPTLGARMAKGLRSLFKGRADADADF